jgi:hypothetical protein
MKWLGHEPPSVTRLSTVIPDPLEKADVSVQTLTISYYLKVRYCGAVSPHLERPWCMVEACWLNVTEQRNVS